MKKKDFSKVLEKILHCTVITMHVGFAITGVSIGLFNPTPSFCYIAPGPYGCSSNDEVDCRFGDTAPYFYEAFAQFWIQLAYVVIIVTNLLIWLYVKRQENQMKKYRTRLQSQTADDTLNNMEKESSYARSVFIQSILYVGAFFLSWSWATIYHLVAWFGGVSVPWITLLINTFLPLQGFWNAFIYARPRYIRIRKTKGNLSALEILKLVFLPPKDDHVEGATNHGKSSVAAVESSGVFKSFQYALKRRSRKLSTAESSSLPVPPIQVTDEEVATEANVEESLLNNEEAK